MNTPVDLKRLSDYFGDDDIEWKPIVVSRKTNKGLAAAYVTNRAIMDRLDEVCGPANWKNEFMPGPNGGVVCGLSIRVERGEGAGGFAEWITKWDGAENTDIEAVKGGLSSSMRRAAVQWGIGRYLYKLPSQWVAVDDNGRFKQPPRVPAAFRPRGERAGAGDGAATSEAPVPSPAPAQTERRPAASTSGKRHRPTSGRRTSAPNAPASAPEPQAGRPSQSEEQPAKPSKQPAKRTSIDDEARQYMMPSRPPGR